MQICPQDATVNVFDHLEEVMVVVPVDAEKDKTNRPLLIFAYIFFPISPTRTTPGCTTLA
jgi:hypothetical protein